MHRQFTLIDRSPLATISHHFRCLRSPSCCDTRYHCYSRVPRPYFRGYGTNTKLRRLPQVRIATFITSAAFTAVGIYMYITDARANFYTWLADPLTRIIWPNADDAHTAGIRSLEALYRYNLHPRERGNSFQDLEVKVFGYILDNPIGISAGLDKNGSIISPLFELGPALVEIGGITPYPQEGNPKPRIFRIPSQQSLINRCGMNSEGAAAVASRLQQRRKAIVRQDGHDSEDVLNGTANVPTGSLIKGKLLAIQIAKQETTPEHDITAIQRDFILCTKALAEHADIIVLNVSCPNGRYRHLQQAEYLTAILNGVVTAARQVKVRTPPAVMVKVSPDYDDSEQIRNICKAVHASHTDGIVVGNSTTRRPVPLDARLSKADATNMLEKGGFSGPALFDKTLYLVRQYRRTLDDEAYISRIGGQTMSEPKVIFCTGGVVNGSQALEVLKAGASLAQVYTAMVYGGAGHISRMKQEMQKTLNQ